MNLWSLPLIAGLSLALPLVPTSAEAPGQESSGAANAFTQVGEAGFSYRWVDEDTSIAEGLQCNFYSWCAFADIVGPACPDEVLVELDYFDKDDWYVASGADVLPGSGRQKHIHVELGTNHYDGLGNIEIPNISCYLGLPTGKPDI